MTYRERRERKAERLREWASKREEKSDALHDRARAMADVIPFGQPILVGHYSEGRDRRYRARVNSAMDAAYANDAKAASMSHRAASIESQLAGAIYSDDPDAIDALEARIAKLEARREQIKTENAAFRKAHAAELKTLSAFERDRAMPHPGYVLQNLTGNITRNRQRLEGLKRQALNAS
jgi:hypothetical protein